MSILNNVKYLSKLTNWKLTKEDFYTLSNERKAELIHGIMVTHSPVSLTHASVFNFLMRLIGGYVEEKNLGIVLGENTAVEFSNEIVYEPDICFISNKKLRKVKETKIIGVPDLIIEIVSPATAENDYILKKKDYEKFKVKEYWIINPYKKEVKFFILKKSKYKEIKSKNNIFYSQILKNFYLNTSWLWNYPYKFPKISSILKPML